MTCPACSGAVWKHGRNRNGTQRYRCKPCRKTFSEKRWSVGNIYLPKDKVLIIATLLVEGCSIRSAERTTGIHRNTICKLLGILGAGCARFLRRKVRKVAPDHLEIDEVWSFVDKKQKRLKSDDDERFMGDAYTFIALARNSRLVAAWHLGKRDEPSTAYFITKVRDATKGKFQISSDAFPAYEPAIESGLHDRADYARIVKVVGPDAKQAVLGNPDMSRCETTYVERLNGSLRLWMKRMNRATYASSKKWKNLEAALALQFAHYNFCQIHSTLRVTPAMEAKLARRPWGLDKLLAEAVG